MVGPLPCTVKCNRYMYNNIMIYLYTKYPEAIPLCHIDNKSVLEAMLGDFFLSWITQNVSYSI